MADITRLGQGQVLIGVSIRLDLTAPADVICLRQASAAPANLIQTSEKVSKHLDFCINLFRPME